MDVTDVKTLYFIAAIKKGINDLRAKTHFETVMSVTAASNVVEGLEHLQSEVTNSFNKLEESEEVSPELNQALGALLLTKLLLDPNVEKSRLSIAKQLKSKSLTLEEQTEHVIHLLELGLLGYRQAKEHLEGGDEI